MRCALGIRNDQQEPEQARPITLYTPVGGISCMSPIYKVDYAHVVVEVCEYEK